MCNSVYTLLTKMLPWRAQRPHRPTRPFSPPPQQKHLSSSYLTMRQPVRLKVNQIPLKLLIKSTIETVVDSSNSSSSTPKPDESSSPEASSSVNSTVEEPPTTTTTAVDRERRATSGQQQVLVSRGCQSSDFLQGTLLASSAMSEGRNTTYIHVCRTDLCNYGDGRNNNKAVLRSFASLNIVFIHFTQTGLKCYECKGSGTGHPCMTKPATTANIVTCFANQYCSLERRVSNVTEANNVTGTH